MSAVAARRPWSLRATLLAAFLALLLLAGGVVALFVADRVADDEARRARDFLARKAEQYANLVHLAIDARSRLLAMAASSRDWEPLLAEPSAARGALQALQRLGPPDLHIDLIDARGHRVASSDEAAHEADVSLHRWFVAGLRGAALHDVASSQASADAPVGSVLVLAEPARGSGGRAVGVLVAHVDTTLLATLAASNAMTRGVRFAYAAAIVGNDARARGGAPSFPAGLALRINRGAGSDGSVEPAGGPPMLAASHALDDAPVNALGWTALVVAPEHEVRGSAAALLRRAALAATAAAALVLPLVLLLAHRIAWPLHRLTAALERTRSYAEAQPEPIPVGGPRETVQLGLALRRMLDEIAAQQTAAIDSATGYRELFERHPLPMWVIDQQTLRFLEVNQMAVQRYGWSRDEFLAMSVLDIRPEDAHEAVRRMFAQTREQEHYHGTWQHRLRSGEVIDAEIASRRLTWAGRDARIVGVRDVTQQRQASRTLQQQRRELSELAQRLLGSEESERRRLAQVLHDRYAPTLYGIKLSIESLLARPGLLADDAAGSLRPAVQALDASLADVRGLMSDLRPPLLAEHGLGAALRHEVQRRRQAAGGDVRIELEDASDPTEAPVRHDAAAEYALFMIAREALHNALLHGESGCTVVSIESSATRLEVTVRDDGSGFDASAAPPAGHLGLVGMRERAAWIGARLHVDSGAGGTTVRVTWPAR